MIEKTDIRAVPVHHKPAIPCIHGPVDPENDKDYNKYSTLIVNHIY